MSSKDLIWSETCENPDGLHLCGLPLIIQATDDLRLSHVTWYLRQVYRARSIHTMFVQEAFNAQSRGLPGNLKDLLGLLRSELFYSLCKVHTLLASKGQVITNLVNSCVLPAELRSIKHENNNELCFREGR